MRTWKTGASLAWVGNRSTPGRGWYRLIQSRCGCRPHHGPRRPMGRWQVRLSIWIFKVRKTSTNLRESSRARSCCWVQCGRHRTLRSLCSTAVKMMTEEHVAAIITPSRDGGDGGGTGIIFDDNGANIVRNAQVKAKAVTIPKAAMNIEHSNRLGA